MAETVVIIPNWNGRDLLDMCLPTVFEQTYADFEVVVVDNGSTDGSLEMLADRYPQVKVITNGANLGLPKALNIGIKATTAPYVVTLNNDTKVEPDWLGKLVEEANADSGVGTVAPKMIYMDSGNLLDSAGIEVDRLGFHWNRLNGLPEDPSELEPYEVFGPSSGAALYRRAMLDDIGLFDGEYFIYYDDTDMAWRARLMGWRCIYVPTARVFHMESATMRNASPFKRFLISRNRWWTVAKNYPSPDIWLRMPGMLLNDLLSTAYRLWAEKNLSPIKGRLAVFGRLGPVLKQRRVIQQKRRISTQEMRDLLIPPPSTLGLVRQRMVKKP